MAARSIRGGASSSESRRAFDEYAARLVPVTYQVVAGTSEVPTGTTVTIMEDPDRIRARKEGTR